MYIEITDMAEDGTGIGHTEGGMTLFVSGAVYGDKVLAGITKEKKNYGFAEVKELVEPSPHRITRKTDFDSESNQEKVCPYFEECGGCAFGLLDYKTQLELKKKHVSDKLKRIGGIDNPEVKEILGMEGYPGDWPVNYRNKAVIAVTQDGTGIPYVGFKGRKSHKVIDCENCMIQSPPANEASKILREYLKKHRVPIKQMTVKTAFESGEVMVILGVKGKDELPDIEEFCYDLDDAINRLGYSLESGVLEREYIVREGGKKGPLKTSTKTKLEFIAGKRTIQDELLGLNFEISPLAFYQVNPVQTRKLYSKVLEYLFGSEYLSKQDEGRTRDRGMILDLYCGVGTIGTLIAKNYEGRILGIESVKDAVIDANRNAVINGVVNEQFLCGKAEEVVPPLVESQIDKVYATILDPPRSGCDEKLLKAVVSAKPNKIIYVSCNPGTLARDVKILMEKGYEFIETTPVDMFCHSSHVECVALLQLSNRKSDTKIRIDVNLEDYYRIKDNKQSKEL